MDEKDVNYQPEAPDPSKSCASCKNFEAGSEGMGKCFGKDVTDKGTCNFFEPKE
ncbi:MAG: hypothetical protein HQ538_02275 [Parcubacteria group bacterium]|nr:hypothetical protein [Parcubacteria group bacterium]